jgi:hypothetical protein
LRERERKLVEIRDNVFNTGGGKQVEFFKIKNGGSQSDVIVHIPGAIEKRIYRNLKNAINSLEWRKAVGSGMTDTGMLTSGGKGNHNPFSRMFPSSVTFPNEYMFSLPSLIRPLKE